MFTPALMSDAYKLSHRGFMEPGTEQIYSNMTARSFKHMPVVTEDFDNKLVVTHIQAFCFKLRKLWDKGFFNKSKEKAVRKFHKVVMNYLGPEAANTLHLEELHDLGHLPLIIKALPEGSLVNEKVPFLTITNTHPNFAWLVNYLETFMSCELWKPMTVATIARQYRLLSNKFALKTTGSIAGTEWQNHDFSFRGMSGVEDAAACGAAFLLSSSGTDTTPALEYLEKYYQAKPQRTFVAGSVPASEHSLASTGIAVRGELETYRKWITQDYPTGIVSVIADTLDFFRVITEFATLLKDDILNRQPNELGLAKVVFRPDSGCPVKILTGYLPSEIGCKSNFKNSVRKDTFYCLNTGKELSEAEVKGAVECLWDIFGGTTTEQGYKMLHERVGLIYGDSITLERAKAIYTRLAEKGFASLNVVLGIGSYTNQYLTRDSAGMAVKATAAKVNGNWYELSKDPKTDDGTKKSAKGLLRVEKQGQDFVLYDQQTPEQEDSGELSLVFINGVLVWETFEDIKQRLWS